MSPEIILDLSAGINQTVTRKFGSRWTDEREKERGGDSYFATVLFVTIRSSAFMQLIRDFTFSEEYWHVCTFFKFEDTFEIRKNVICVIVCLFNIFYRNYVSCMSYLLYLSGISKRISMLQKNIQL